MADHDPQEFVTSLAAKLATRSRHVCVFLGAGTSKSCGLPDLNGLQEHVLSALEEESRAALEHQLSKYNLEDALSRIRRISALIAGPDTVDGLTSEQARALDDAICRQIVKSLSIEPEDRNPAICLAAWSARRATYCQWSCSQ